MALTTAYNPLTLNAIHVEAGGTTETQASINDADIRALIGKAAGVQMAFSEWYGASSSSDSQTVTVGNNGTVYGFVIAGHSSSFGSISDGTSNLYNGATINRLTWASTSILGGTAHFAIFELAGTRANSGWTSMTVGSTTLSRTSASFTQDNSGPSSAARTLWVWNTTNLVGATSGTQVVTWA